MNAPRPERHRRYPFLAWWLAGLTLGSLAGCSGSGSPGDPESITLPNPPIGVAATAGDGQVALRWTALANATSYQVYQATASEAQSATPVKSNVTTTSTVIGGLSNGITYFFKIKGVRGAEFSPYSGEVSATPAAVASVDVTVSLATPLASTKLRQGFLHGITDAPSGTLPVVDALAPHFWRLSGIFNAAPYTFVTANQFPATHGTRIQWVLADDFSITYGNPVVVDPACNPTVGPSCIRSFDELRSVWAAFVEDFMDEIAAQNVQIDDFDIFSEPDVYWRGITVEQFLEMFMIAHDVIRSHRPEARIVAPSTSRVAADGFKVLFDYAVAHELKLDAVTWHELERAGDIAAHVVAVRSAIDTAYAGRADLKPTEVQINEYGSPQASLIPGWSVAYLAELERAGVDAAARACWDVTPSWNSCRRGLDGLLDLDQATPQPVYWVYWAYARMPATRTAVSVRTGLAAIASRDEVSGEVSLLVGRESCGASGSYCVGAGLPVAKSPLPSRDVVVRVTGLGAATSATVTRTRLPGATQPAILPTPEALPEQTIAIAAGELQVALPAFEDGGAFIVVLAPVP